MRFLKWKEKKLGQDRNFDVFINADEGGWSGSSASCLSNTKFLMMSQDRERAYVSLFKERSRITVLTALGLYNN